MSSSPAAKALESLLLDTFLTVHQGAERCALVIPLLRNQVETAIRRAPWENRNRLEIAPLLMDPPYARAKVDYKIIDLTL